MKTWKIPVEWAVFGTIEVTANSVEEAIQILEDTQEDISLPKGEYIDGSFVVEDNLEFVQWMNQEQ